MENSAGITRTVELRLSRADFGGAYLRDLSPGGLFVPTTEFYNLGETLILRLEVEGLAGVAEVAGSVAWHRRPRTWRSNLPPGIGFVFDRRHEELSRFLADYCSGRISDRREAGRRAGAEFPVRFLLDGSWVAGKAQNICPGGIFVLTGERVELGTTLKMKLFMGGLPAPADCVGQPTWQLRDGGKVGFGARFSTTSSALKRRLSGEDEAKKTLTSSGTPRSARATLSFGKR